MNDHIVLKDMNGQYHAFSVSELREQISGSDVVYGLSEYQVKEHRKILDAHHCVANIKNDHFYGSEFIEPEIEWPDGVTHCAIGDGSIIFAGDGNSFSTIDVHDSFDSGPTRYDIVEREPLKEGEWRGKTVRTIYDADRFVIFSRTID